MTDTPDAARAQGGAATAVKAAGMGALVVLAAAQFLMVLDQAVMNVSISQLVADFDTSVTAIQGVITFYSLVMAALMITGGKVGDLIGRRRAFTIGMVIYGCGSALTAAAWSLPILTLGWSVLEGIGAALVLPALAALVAGNFTGDRRKLAYGVIGGVAGAGIAVGPILGGWATTELSWRVVFLGEVVVVIAILLCVRLVDDSPREGRAPHLDVVGSVLSAAGMALTVLAVLQASTWGWIQPKSSPVTVLGFSLTPFMLVGGLGLLWAFARWQRHRESTGRDPLLDLGLFKVPPVRSGLLTLGAQNVILMGIFFVMPLYLQLVLGFDALETGIKLLPTSVMMLLTSSAGPALSRRWPVRGIVRVGVLTLLVSALVLLGTIQPNFSGTPFAVAMGLLGVGMGLVASQLGNVIQSSVGASHRSEAGGLQYTAQQFGSALGVALIGAIVISGLAANFASRVTADDRLDATIKDQVSVTLESGVSFVPSTQVEAAAQEAGLSTEATAALVDSYEDAQLVALKAGLLAVAAIAAAALLATSDLPSRRDDGEGRGGQTDEPGPQGP